MSARTAAKRLIAKRARSRSNEPVKPLVKVAEVDILSEGSDSDWFAPKVLRVRPRRISISLGRRGCGQQLVELEESDWERKLFWLHIYSETKHRPECKFDAWLNDGAPMTLDGLNHLIQCLTLARAEAAERGFFDRRPTPKSIQEVADALNGAAQ